MAFTKKPDVVKKFDKAVTRNVVAKREEAGLTQARMAELLGIERQNLWKYENEYSAFSVFRLHSIAKILGCKVDDFFP